MGPKKQKKNDFYYYMTKRKPDIEKLLGRTVTMKEMPGLVGADWQNLPESEKAKYRAMKRGGKDKGKDLWHTYDSWGIPLAAIQQEEEEKRLKVQNMSKEISETINRAVSANALQKKSFFIITTSYYLQTLNGDYVPAELGLLQFNFESGIMKELSYIFHCNIPRGYRFEAKLHSDKTHHLPFENPHATSNFNQVFQEMVDFVGKEGTQIPPLYTLEEEQEQTEGILQKLNGGEEEYFKIYCIEQLFQEIYNSVFPEYHIPRSIARDKILHCGLDFHPSIPCQWHQENESDSGKFCAIGCCRRYVFMMCDNMKLFKTFGIKPRENYHLPRATVPQGIVINYPKNRNPLHSYAPMPRNIQAKHVKAEPQSEGAPESDVRKDLSDSDEEEDSPSKWAYGSDFPPLQGAVAISPKKSSSSAAGSIQSVGRGTSTAGSSLNVGHGTSSYGSSLCMGRGSSTSRSIQGIGRGTSLASVAKLITIPRKEDSSIQSDEVSEVSTGMQNVSIGGIGRGTRRHRNPQAPFLGIGRGLRFRREESTDKDNVPH